MTCDIHLSAVDAVWPALLQMLAWSRQSEGHDNGHSQVVCLVNRSEPDSGWRFIAGLPSPVSYPQSKIASVVVIPMGDDRNPLEGVSVQAFASCSLFRWEPGRVGTEQSDIVLEDVGARPLARDARAALRLYLPTIVGAHRARQKRRAFVTAHIAQTLDGRIACLNGRSQWISNRDNLIHSHRLRALHDAVMVGTKTLVNDNPRLTVRHVEGQNPRRVLVTGSGASLLTHSHHHLFSDHGVLALVGETSTKGLKLPSAWHGTDEPIQIHPLPQDANGCIAPADIASALHAHNLSSVFVEGGGATISSFMQQGGIDLLHIHIAPKILGSGVSSFTLPEVSEIHDGKTFAVRHFSLNGEILFECRRLTSSSRPS